MTVDESRLRFQQYLKRGGCTSMAESKEACHALSIWKEEDIYTYKDLYGLSFCEIYCKGANRTGCMICGFGAHLETESRFYLPFELYPKAYNLFMGYKNNGVTYREALHYLGIDLPDDLL